MQNAEKVEIGYTLPKERWQEAAKNLEDLGNALAARQQAGQIRDLRLQVDFTLQEAFTDTEGKRVRAIRYKADFTYYQPPNRQLYGSHAPYYAEQSGVPWEFVVEDVKSKATRTAKYAMKKKMLKDRFGYDITEV